MKWRIIKNIIGGIFIMAALAAMMQPPAIPLAMDSPPVLLTAPSADTLAGSLQPPPWYAELQPAQFNSTSFQTANAVLQ